MIMQNRLWKIVAIMLMVGIAAAGYFLGVEPQLAAARTADEQREAVEMQNEASRLAITRLVEEEKDLPTLQAKLSELQRAIPLDAGVPAFFDDLSGLAAKAGVSISSLTVAPAVPYAAPLSAAPAPAPVPDAAATDGGEPAAAGSVPAVETTVAPVAITNPLITSENMILIPITVGATGTYAQVLDFVNGLQTGPRLFLVQKFSSVSTSGAEAGQVTGTATGYIYVLLNQYDPAARAAAAAEAQAAADAAATPSPTETPIP